MTVMAGMHWRVTVNGRRAANGKRYSATYTGAVERVAPDTTIYDLMRDLAAHIEQQNAEMELPDSFQMTLYPKKIEP